jgi:two-component system chemotaxis response regulator CheY
MALAKQIRVMVVDDTSTSRMLVCDALDQLGISQVVLANDGEQALKTMMTQPCHMIISDFNMPKLDGLGLLQAIRSYAPTKNTPFIILTGKGDRALVERAAKMGVNNYLTKPFTVPALKAAIEAVIGKLQ